MKLTHFYRTVPLFQIWIYKEALGNFIYEKSTCSLF